MSLESDTRDRVIRLEAEVAQLKESISEIKEKTEAMYDILNQAKGARLIGWLMFGAAGFLISWIPTALSYLTNKGA